MSNRAVGRRKSATRRQFAARLGTLMVAFAAATAAQTLEQVHRREGLQLYSASAFGAYYSEGLGQRLGFSGLGDTLNSDSAVGAMASMGWSTYRERSNFAITYSPGYLMSVREPDSRISQHMLVANGGKKLSARWSAGLGLNALLNSTPQYLFTPSVFAQIASVPATFDDLVQGMLRNQYNNFELASLLTGAPLLQSPVRGLLYGDRLLTVSLRNVFSYSYSPRTSIDIDVHGMRSQFVSPGRNAGGPGLLDRSTMGGASIGISHSLSSRTQLGITASAGRTVSRFQDVYQSILDVQLGRAVSRRWLVQFHGGTGFLTALRETRRLSTGLQWEGGASAVFKTGTHSLMASADRAFGDAYGIGAASTITLRGVWNWAPQGTNWSTEISFAQQYYRNSLYSNLDGWQAEAGVIRRLTPHTSVHLEYTHLSYSGLSGISGRTDQGALRAALVWNALPIRKPVKQE